MSGNDFHLGIFAKYWQPGRVKTRLATALGNEVAAEVYRLFVTHLLERLGTRGRSREIVFSPDDRHQEFADLVDSVARPWRLQPQGRGDLGARLHRFFRHHLTTDVPTVVLGSDSPTLPLEYLAQASTLLVDNKVVLGPSEDGGYYLIAVRGAELPPIFEGIAWSSSGVWEQTVKRLRVHGVPYGVLPKWYDVDDDDQLRRLLGELEAATAHSHEGRLYRGLQDVLTTKR